MTSSSSSGRQVARVLPANPMRAGIAIVSFTALLYVLELVDSFLGPQQPLNAFGILPRQIDGLDGVLWAPLLHDGFGHLLANTIPLVVFGFLAMAGGVGQFIAVTVTIWLIGGLGTWVTGGEGVHLGASGLVFGWLVFLLLRGFFNRSLAQIGVAVVLFAIWGGVLWGMLPIYGGNVSWQGHLFGALGGLLAAWLVAKANRPQKRGGTPGQIPGVSGR